MTTSPTVLCAQILLLAAEDPTKDINLYINSPGGSISARHGDLRHHGARAVRRRHLRDGHGRVDGRVPARGGHQGQALRAAARPDPDAPALGRDHGGAADIAIQAEQFALIKREMFRLNAEFTGQTIERIEADSDRDRGSRLRKRSSTASSTTSSPTRTSTE